MFMAAASSSSSLTSNRLFTSHSLLNFPFPLNSSSYSQNSHPPNITILYPSKHATNFQTLKLKNIIPRASMEGFPVELTEEDSKFVPLTDEEPGFGPPALLLVGFEVEEAAKIQQLLKDMDGEFLQIIYCTENMISRSLWEAVNTRQTDLKTVQIAKDVPRICFLSGLSGEEMMMFIDAFNETGLDPAVFAAVVPNSADKPISELLEEIMGDHEMLTGKQKDST